MEAVLDFVTCHHRNLPEGEQREALAMKKEFFGKGCPLFGILLILSFGALGCAATQVALEKKDLKIETKMSSTIFLDIESEPEKTVYISLKNTSDKDVDIGAIVIQYLQAKGYTVKSSPKEAYYILQGNILYVGQADPAALHQVLLSGYGSVLGGAAGGAVIGGATGGSKGALLGAGIGGLVAGAVDLIAGSLVKDVTFTIVTDLMISERSQEAVEQNMQSGLQQGTETKIIQSSKKVTQSKKYQTRIVSTANQVNLKLEECLGPLGQGLSKSIVGIF